MKITVFWDMKPCRMIFTDGLGVFVFSLLFQFSNLIRYFHQFLSFLFSFSSFCCPLPRCVRPTVLLSPQHNLSLAFLRQSLNCFLSYLMERVFPRNSLFFDCSEDWFGQLPRDSDN